MNNKTTLTKTAVLVVGLCLANQLAAQLPKQLEVKELQLSNGMKVWLNEDHSQPKVFGAVVVNAGAKDCIRRRGRRLVRQAAYSTGNNRQGTSAFPRATRHARI